MKGDALSIIEAAYDDAPSVDVWLARIAEAAVPVLDRGFGVLATLYTVGDDGTVSIGPVHGRGTAASLRTAVDAARLLERQAEEFSRALSQSSVRAMTARLYPRAARAGSLSQISGLCGGGKAVERAVGMTLELRPDAIGILAGDPSGYGATLSADTASLSHLTPPMLRLWTHVGVHLAAGLRLVRSRSARVDAVLTPGGRLEHAEPEAQGGAERASLRDAARAIDRARGRMRRAEPDEAIALWQGLVDGSWSLVNHVDTDGRRYLFAKHNAPQARRWRDLTERERQILAYAAEGHAHKMIAYELGIGVPTIARCLKSAARKVGAASRIELIRAYRAAAGAIS
jgi:DNA-binding CsgD family transcriptional regulator